MRIVTRPDFDGIVCAVLLSDALETSDPIKWVEPNAMQHGLIEIRPNDVIANLAYNEKCAMWFDHHESNRRGGDFEGVFKIAPSAAGIIFEYFNHHKSYPNPFKKDYRRLVAETDKIDSADLTLEEVLNPEKNPYVALSSTIYSHNSADEPYWNRLVELLRTRNIEEIVKDDEVKERIRKSVDADIIYRDFLTQHTTLQQHVTVTDFRPLGKAPSGNRFIVFSLFPESVVNVKVRFENEKQEKVVISVGHSIFNRGCQVSAGEICSHFGGGGHRGAGSCSVPASEADKAMATIMDILLKNHPTTFPILYEDHFLIAVDKPPGLLSESKRVLNYKGTLFTICPLEKQTSGIVLFAKSEKVRKVLQNEMQQQEIKRAYYAIVDKTPPEKEGTVYDWDKLNNNHTANPLYLATRYWQLHTCSTGTLLQIESVPDNPTDLRTHLARLDCPILGDHDNGSLNDPINRLALHAYFVAFTHPVSHKRIVIETKLPQSFKSYCQDVKENKLNRNAPSPEKV